MLLLLPPKRPTLMQRVRYLFDRLVRIQNRVDRIG